jgi:hypothetical protein
MKVTDVLYFRYVNPRVVLMSVGEAHDGDKSCIFTV